MGASIIDHAAGFGPEWFFAIIVAVGFGLLAKGLLDEYKRQNERKAQLEEKNAARQAEIEMKREERKREEQQERAKRDREHSMNEGRIASQMERSNSILEATQSSMEALKASNEALHEEIINSREHSRDMGERVDHILDRVDLIYENERMNND